VAPKRKTNATARRRAPTRSGRLVLAPVLRRAAGFVVAAVAIFLGGLGVGTWVAGDPPDGTERSAATMAQTTAQPPRVKAGTAADPAPSRPLTPSKPVRLAVEPVAPKLRPDLPVEPPALIRVTPEGVAGAAPERTAALPPPPAPEGGEPPAWQRHAVAAIPVRGRPMIAIVLDDLGIDKRRSARAINLKAPLTLAFLPYATQLEAQTAEAKAQGHELLVHMPMRPHNPEVDPGPDVLDITVGAGELRRRLRHNLDRFIGYVGINNHMGSRFTESGAGTELVAAELRARGLLFLDSLTSPNSVAAASARTAGVPTVERDVFLDNVDSVEEVRRRLEQTERVAREQGTAIAIGHPRDATLAVLMHWLDEVRARGFAIVPLTQIVRARTGAPKLAEATE